MNEVGNNIRVSMTDGGCLECKKTYKPLAKTENCRKATGQSDNEKILEVFGKYTIISLSHFALPV